MPADCFEHIRTLHNLFVRVTFLLTNCVDFCAGGWGPFSQFQCLCICEEYISRVPVSVSAGRHRWHFKLQTTGTSNCQFDDASRTAENIQTNEASTARQSSKQIQLCKCRHQHGEVQIQQQQQLQLQRYRYYPEIRGNYATVSGTSTRDMPRWKCKGNRDKSQPHDILKLSDCPHVRLSVVRVGGQRTTVNGHPASNRQYSVSREYPTGSALNFSLNQLSKQSFVLSPHGSQNGRNAQPPFVVLLSIELN